MAASRSPLPKIAGAAMLLSGLDALIPIVQFLPSGARLAPLVVLFALLAAALFWGGFGVLRMRSTRALAAIVINAVGLCIAIGMNIFLLSNMAFSLAVMFLVPGTIAGLVLAAVAKGPIDAYESAQRHIMLGSGG